MEISSKNKYPSSALSNFAPHHFFFEGVECASMEGLLQSFKFDKPHIQVEVCKLIGMAAKKRGSDRSRSWQQVQKLWWKGKSYDRKGPEYQQLLDKAYIALAKNESFRKALIAAKTSSFTHSIGKNKDSDTVLTTREFCSRLTRLRELIVANVDLTTLTKL